MQCNQALLSQGLQSGSWSRSLLYPLHIARFGRKFCTRRGNAAAQTCQYKGFQLAKHLQDKQTGRHHSDISKLKPELQQQWHVGKNVTFGNSTVNPFSFEIAVWKCLHCQHEWQATVLDRAVDSTDCPHCLHSRRYQMLCNDDEYPFASQWNHLQNARDGVFPEDTKAGSLQPVWWQCKECPQKWPHEWLASPVSRLSESYTCCPFCSSINRCICNQP